MTARPEWLTGFIEDPVVANSDLFLVTAIQVGLRDILRASGMDVDEFALVPVALDAAIRAQSLGGDTFQAAHQAVIDHLLAPRVSDTEEASFAQPASN